MLIVGYVDKLENGEIFGWAFNSDVLPEHLEIAVYVEETREILASGVASLLRSDLIPGGVGDGDHAFRFKVVTPLALNDLVVVARSTDHGERRIRVFSGKFDDSDLHTVTVIKPILAGIAERLSKFEERMSVMDSYITRIDHSMSELSAVPEKRRKRFFLVF